MKATGYPRTRLTGLALSVVILSLLAIDIRAERLPIKTYTIEEGLGANNVADIVQDSHGFLWFCTSEGLGRFDGYSFVTYGTEHGLSYPAVTCLLETRKGRYLVGTGAGACWFYPSAARSSAQAGEGNPLFKACGGITNTVMVMHEDRSGRIWAGAIDGLYMLDEKNGETEFQRIDLKPVVRPTQYMTVEALAEDHEGNIWVGTTWGLFLIFPDGDTSQVSTQPDGRIEPIRPLMTDREGRVWIGHMTRGLVVIKPSSNLRDNRSRTAPGLLLSGGKDITPRDGLIQLPSNPGEFARYTAQHGIAENNIWSLCQTSDGNVWIGTVSKGLTEFDGRRFRTFTRAEGLIDQSIKAVTEDAAGNLWMGTEAGGAMKLARNGLTSYTTADGLGDPRSNSIFEDKTGNLYVVTGFGNRFINRYDGRAFTSVKPLYPERIEKGGLNRLGWGWKQISFQDSAGQWWVPTSEGVLLYPKVPRLEDLSRTRPKALYTTRDGLPDNNIFRLFEDSRGDVWISTIFPHRSAIARWVRATEKIEDLSTVDVISGLGAAMVFCEDSAGNLWVGFYDGGLARYSGGRWRSFLGEDGFPKQRIFDLYLDSRGRLWIATGFGGAVRVDDPHSENPRPVYYKTENGLASNDVRAITEDRNGYIYLCNNRSIDRLAPETGEIRRYTTADGLIGSNIRAAYRDRSGALWFATLNGVSRLIPEPDKQSSPPAVLITGVHIKGDRQALSELGETELAVGELSADRNHIQIDFVSINLVPGMTLRYQYMLEGADDDWSEPTAERKVNYPNLPPGSYRFIVRAINSQGISSDRPASFSFVILRPVWQRWWFLTIAAALISMTVYAAYRYRVAHLIALERVRTRIATDLHDDIGSSLTHIAILSEVARQQAGQDELRVAGPLSTIATTSRELVDSMADIVWAINPKKDYLLNLTQRMRRIAIDTFTARNIEFSFKAPGADENIRLETDMRRQVFLIFKEGVNNIVRHSDCTFADIDFRAESGWLVLKMRDNGKGLPDASESDGHGLLSMRQRAESLGGEFTIVSNNGKGTSVVLRVPLGHNRRWRAKRMLHKHAGTG